MPVNILLLAAAGALGTLARVGLAGAVHRLVGGGEGAFPAGTFAVNAVGCFLFGLVWPLAEERLLISPQSRAIVLAGFMGAFTTFSTFAFESGQFLKDGAWGMAAANIAAQNVVGIILLLAGMATAKLL